MLVADFFWWELSLADQIRGHELAFSHVGPINRGFDMVDLPSMSIPLHTWGLSSGDMDRWYGGPGPTSDELAYAHVGGHHHAIRTVILWAYHWRACLCTRGGYLRAIGTVDTVGLPLICHNQLGPVWHHSAGTFLRLHGRKLFTRLDNCTSLIGFFFFFSLIWKLVPTQRQRFRTHLAYKNRGRNFSFISMDIM